MSYVLSGSAQVRKLGRVDIRRREDYAELLDTKVELIRSLVPLGLMHVEEVLDEEVTALTPGLRRSRRHGRNPGTVGFSVCRFGYRGYGASRGADSAPVVRGVVWPGR